jgi:hypothetical protein
MVGDERGIEAGSSVPAPICFSVEASHQRIPNIVRDVGVAVEVDHQVARKNAPKRTHGPVPEGAHYQEHDQ